MCIFALIFIMIFIAALFLITSKRNILKYIPKSNTNCINDKNNIHTLDNSNNSNDIKIIDDGLFINKSNIQGVGVFTSKDIKNGNHIYKVIDSNRNINFIGSKINHSYKPNSILKKNIDNSYSLFAIKFINKNSEIVADYTNTPNFINKPDPSWI